MLGRAKPIGGVTKTQTSKTQTSDPKKLRPPGASKTQTPEKLRPLGVSKTPTLNIFQILQLTVVREQPLSLSHPQKGMVLQKYRLSENSHCKQFRQNQIFDLEQWSFVPQAKDSTLAEGTIYWTKKVTLELELELLKQTVAETLINLFCFCFPSFLSRQRERLLSRPKEDQIKKSNFIIVGLRE